MSKLSVILVSYNDWIHLEKCVQSLKGFLPESDFEIVTVDNNSTDGSPELIKDRFPDVKLICARENLGFARACNLGFSVSAGEFILFLNTDTIANGRAVNLLLDEMKRHPSIGALGPALLSEQGTFQVSFGRRVDFFSELIQKVFFNLYYAKKLKADVKARDVGWLSAACLLVRRTALEEAGLYDENYFLYFEDIDLCYKIKRKGWTLRFFPQAQITHIGGTSTSLEKISSRYHYRKSQIYFYEKHNSRLSRILLRVYLWLIFFVPFSFFRGREGESFGRNDFFRLLGRKNR